MQSHLLKYFESSIVFLLVYLAAVFFFSASCVALSQVDQWNYWKLLVEMCIVPCNTCMHVHPLGPGRKTALCRLLDVRNLLERMNWTHAVCKICLTIITNERG